MQSPQWTEFLSCLICCHMFDESSHRPISLGCGHTVCKMCLRRLPHKCCPFDQNIISRSIDDLPVNFALLQLVGVAVPDLQDDLPNSNDLAENVHHYTAAKKYIEELAMFLKPQTDAPQPTTLATAVTAPNLPLSRPMQRKLVALVNCQLMEEEGRARVIKATRSLGERSVMEMILLHQNPQQLSSNLWAAVRARGCQFLGPGMQEEVLKLILLALEDGSALSRKVLVLFVVQRLETQYPQASKTAIGHVVQLLYRASCFKVTKREEESSLMQLKEEFRTYDALRREHDAQIVQIATEAGLRISPEQWASLLYGDTTHKSHMQSIIDKLQSPQSFSQSINELSVTLQRTGDPADLSSLFTQLELLADIDASSDSPWESWEKLEQVLCAVLKVVSKLVDFLTQRTKKSESGSAVSGGVLMHNNAKYKTNMCRDLVLKGQCPRGASCTFAHSHEEMERYRVRSKKMPAHRKPSAPATLTPKEKQVLEHVTQTAAAKLNATETGDEEDDTEAALQDLETADEHTTTMSSTHQNIVHVVPIAKPSNLPASAKQKITNETIYSSPRVLDDHRQGRQPTIFPITQRAPTYTQSQNADHQTALLRE